METAKSLKEQFGTPKNVNLEHQRKLSYLDKIALLVTNKIGTVGFFLIIFFWTISWLTWNIFAPLSLRFDPLPSFALWLFISNLIQLHLLPLIMIGQNIQAKHAQLRADHDFYIDKKAEKEIEAILTYLENQQSLMLQVLKKLDTR